MLWSLSTGRVVGGTAIELRASPNYYRLRAERPSDEQFSIDRFLLAQLRQ